MNRTYFLYTLANLMLDSCIASPGFGLFDVGKTVVYRWSATMGTSSSIDIENQALYIAVYFDFFSLPIGDEIVVRSIDHAEIFVYNDSSRHRAGFYTSAVRGSHIVIKYRSRNNSLSLDPSLHRITIGHYVYGESVAHTSAICGADNSEPAYCRKQERAPSYTDHENLWHFNLTATARVLVNGSLFCSGWLIGSEGHFITNHHCIPNRRKAVMIDIEFNARSKDCSEDCRHTLACRGDVFVSEIEFITSSEDNDYTIVQIIDRKDISEFGYLQLRGSGPIPSEEIVIPHYPRGYGLQVSKTLDDGSAAIIQGLDVENICGSNQVSYAADTDVGSSGAPVIAVSDNRVVALHHCGQCANTGINVKDIIADLHRKGIFIKDLVTRELSSA